MGFVLGLAVGAALGVITLGALIGFGETGSWSGWAQVIIGAAAVTTAVYVPLNLDYLKRRRDRYRDQAHARAFAHALIPELMEIRARAAGGKNTIVKARYFNPFRSSADEKRCTLPIDGALKRIFDYAGIFPDDIGPTLLQLWGLSSQFNRLVDGVSHTIGVDWRALEKHLDAVITLADEARGALAKIHDTRVLDHS